MWQEGLTVFDTSWSSSPSRLHAREDQELLQNLMLTVVQQALTPTAWDCLQAESSGKLPTDIHCW